MACYHPIQGFRGRPNSSGKRPFVTSISKADSSFEKLAIPCGQCVGCRLEYSRQWAVRCMHESKLYEDNCFITLTYNDKFLPKFASLDYDHWTKFMKRLRFHAGPGVRFFMGPEYGEQDRRPHYHALIFNYDFPDKYYYTKRFGHRIYRSPLLEDLWSDPDTKESYGFSSIGSLTFESAAYVARYVMKKVKGNDHTGRYFRLVDDAGNPIPFPTSDNHELAELAPEKARMSRRPGIARDWFETFKDQTYPRDYIVVNGKKCRPPKYYDRLYEKISENAYNSIRQSRILRSEDFKDDSTTSRLRSREICALKRFIDKCRIL